MTADPVMVQSLKDVLVLPGKELYPVTIFAARYGGAYEYGSWVAIALHHENIPNAATGDDVSCACFFENNGEFLGVGETPSRAYNQLKKVVRGRSV